jgi:ABC-type oligopeptide transport system substrate-binding subunit
MNKIFRWIILAIMALACLPLAACSPAVASAEQVSPAKVEHLSGADPTRITLVPDAVKRLDIQTGEASMQDVDGKQMLVVPYAGLLYDVNGNTWVYVNTAPGVYMRTPVIVDHIDGDNADLVSGPAVGSKIVTVGAEELFGSETEFQEE